MIYKAYYDSMLQLYLTIDTDMDDNWRIAIRKKGSNAWKLGEVCFKSAGAAQRTLDDMAGDTGLDVIMVSEQPITTNKADVYLRKEQTRCV